MAGSKFRRKKLKELDAPSVSEAAPDVEAPEELLVLEHTAYDIVLDPKTNKHVIVAIGFNLDDGSSEITFVKPVTRQVALQFLNQKKALKILAKVHKE